LYFVNLQKGPNDIGQPVLPPVRRYLPFLHWRVVAGEGGKNLFRVEKRRGGEGLVIRPLTDQVIVNDHAVPPRKGEVSNRYETRVQYGNQIFILTNRRIRA
jgi:hypothetical protein